MSLGDWRQYRSLDRQVRHLEKQQRRHAAYADNHDEDAFRLTPTCPPSTSVIFRGGWVWWKPGAAAAFGYYIPSYIVDLADPNKVNMVAGGATPYTYSFTNAYWYLPVIMMLANRCTSCADTRPLGPKETWPTEIPDQSIYLQGTGDDGFFLDEYDNTADAESALRTASRWRTVTNSYGLVVAGLILRNNGNTSEPNQWMVIDGVNRRRSYLFQKMRTGWQWD